MFDADQLYVLEEPAWTIGGTGNQVTCLDYSLDGSLLTFSNRPGVLTVASSFDGEIKREFTQSFSTNPITGSRFHPSEEHYVLSTYRDGFIFLYDFEKNEIVTQTRHLGSSLLCMNIDSFGEQFAIGCADGSIRIYDLNNLQRKNALVKMTTRVGGSSTINIYSLIYHPEDSNILLAAGWNDRIIFWDIRTGNAERSISGPHIRGTGLDIHNNVIYSASERDKKQIEVWEYSTCKKIKDISFNIDACKKELHPMSLSISKNGLTFVSGGIGPNLTQAFDYAHSQYIGQSKPFSSFVNIVSISPFGSAFVSGSDFGELSCHMIRLKPT